MDQQSAIDTLPQPSAHPCSMAFCSTDGLQQHLRQLGSPQSLLDAYAADCHLPRDHAHALHTAVQKQENAARAHNVLAFLERRDVELEQVFSALSSTEPGIIQPQELAQALAGMTAAAEQAQGFHRFQCTPGGVRRLAGRLVDCGGVTRPQWQQFFRVLPSTSMMGDYWLTSHCSRVEGCRSEVINVPQPLKVDGEDPGESNPRLLQAQWRTLLAGGAAGILSRTATAPLETLRVQAMTAPAASVSALHRASAAGRQLHASAKTGLAAYHPATLLERAGASAGSLANRPPAASGALTAPRAAQPARQLLLRPVQKPLRLMGRLWRAAVLIVGRDGWKGLYRGNGLNTLRAGPQKAFDWFFFEAYRGLLHAHFGPTTSATLAAAGLAGTTTCAMLHPLELARTHLTADTSHRYHGALHAMSSLLRTGGLPALYRGLRPSMMAIMPEAAVVYGAFDVLKVQYRRRHGREPGVAMTLAFGVVSAWAGQSLSFPIEAVARRIQVSQGQASIQAVLRQASQQPGGLLSLYAGYAPAVLRMIPMAVVSFGTYELVQGWLSELAMQQATRKAADERMKLLQSIGRSMQERLEGSQQDVSRAMYARH